MPKVAVRRSLQVDPEVTDAGRRMKALLLEELALLERIPIGERSVQQLRSIETLCRSLGAIAYLPVGEEARAAAVAGHGAFRRDGPSCPPAPAHGPAGQQSEAPSSGEGGGGGSKGAPAETIPAPLSDTIPFAVGMEVVPKDPGEPSR